MNQQSASKYDSEFCGNLPIHVINVIQPYGALVLVAKQSGLIVQVSENVTELFRRPPAEVVQTRADRYIKNLDTLGDKVNLPQEIELAGRRYLAIYHDYPEYFILEVNLDSVSENTTATFIDVFHELKETMAAMESADSISSMLQIAAAELKKASNFDKVMIYRFDENWNGSVLAEVKEEDMESYLGVTFPASDIPRPARELYLRNAYRFIPDRTYTPVRLYPVINPLTNKFLDMSDCNVRGVSTVHLEYLKNMNVMASMSTRIIKDGKLWGLIACHHKTAMKMNFKICTVFELLSGILSAKTVALESRESHEYTNSLNEIYTSLVEKTYKGSNLEESFLSGETNILELFGAQGAVISHNGNTIKKGAVPEAGDIEDLILWLNAKNIEHVFYTNSLPREYDYASEFRDIASGMMAIPMNGSNDDFIILFRSEVVQVINWGGDPSTRINFEPDMKTYHPRYSFKIWQEKVMGLSRPWKEAEVEMAGNLKEFVKAFLNGKDYPFKN